MGLERAGQNQNKAKAARLQRPKPAAQNQNSQTNISRAKDSALDTYEKRSKALADYHFGQIGNEEYDENGLNWEGKTKDQVEKERYERKLEARVAMLMLSSGKSSSVAHIIENAKRSGSVSNEFASTWLKQIGSDAEKENLSAAELQALGHEIKLHNPNLFEKLSDQLVIEGKLAPDPLQKTKAPIKEIIAQKEKAAPDMHSRDQSGKSFDKPRKRLG